MVLTTMVARRIVRGEVYLRAPVIDLDLVGGLAPQIKGPCDVLSIIYPVSDVACISNAINIQGVPYPPVNCTSHNADGASDIKRVLLEASCGVYANAVEFKNLAYLFHPVYNANSGYDLRRKATESSEPDQFPSPSAR